MPRTSDFKLRNAQWCTVVTVLRLTLRLRESIYFDKLFRAEPIKTVTLLWQNFVPLPLCPTHNGDECLFLLFVCWFVFCLSSLYQDSGLFKSASLKLTSLPGLRLSNVTCGDLRFLSTLNPTVDLLSPPLAFLLGVGCQVNIGQCLLSGSSWLRTGTV